MLDSRNQSRLFGDKTSARKRSKAKVKFTARVRHRFAPMADPAVEKVARTIFDEAAFAAIPCFTSHGSSARPGRRKGYLQWYVVVEPGTWALPAQNRRFGEIKEYAVGACPVVFVTLSCRHGVGTAVARVDDQHVDPDTLFHRIENA